MVLEIKVLASTSDHAADVTAYASIDSGTGEVLVLAINKRTDADSPTTRQLSGPVNGQVDLFRYAGGVAIDDPGREHPEQYGTRVGSSVLINDAGPLRAAALTWDPDSPLPVAPELAEDVVHVWWASLDFPPLLPERLLGVLSAGERATAEQHHFERDKSRSAASRGLLRWLLGGYLGMRPELVRLRFGPHGKPELADDQARSALFFNVAHCEDVALYALAREHVLGIDVEHLRPMPDAADMAARFFAPAEHAALLTLPAKLRDEGFFVCWTRKEAFVKAQGAGLSVPLDEFEVGLDRRDGAGRVRIPADPRQAALWSVHDLHPQEGFIGALAVAGGDVRLHCWRWV